MKTTKVLISAALVGSLGLTAVIATAYPHVPGPHRGVVPPASDMSAFEMQGPGPVVPPCMQGAAPRGYGHGYGHGYGYGPGYGYGSGYGYGPGMHKGYGHNGGWGHRGGFHQGWGGYGCPMGMMTQGMTFEDGKAYLRDLLKLTDAQRPLFDKFMAAAAEAHKPLALNLGSNPTQEEYLAARIQAQKTRLAALENLNKVRAEFMKSLSSDQTALLNQAGRRAHPGMMGFGHWAQQPTPQAQKNSPAPKQL